MLLIAAWMCFGALVVSAAVLVIKDGEPLTPSGPLGSFIAALCLVACVALAVFGVVLWSLRSALLDPPSGQR